MLNIFTKEKEKTKGELKKENTLEFVHRTNSFWQKIEGDKMYMYVKCAGLSYFTNFMAILEMGGFKVVDTIIQDGISTFKFDITGIRKQEHKELFYKLNIKNIKEIDI